MGVPPPLTSALTSALTTALTSAPNLRPNPASHVFCITELCDESDLSLLGPKPRKKSGSHIDASHSRQPLVKGERLVRNEVNAVMLKPLLDIVCVQNAECGGVFEDVGKLKHLS